MKRCNDMHIHEMMITQMLFPENQRLCAASDSQNLREGEKKYYIKLRKFKRHGDANCGIVHASLPFMKYRMIVLGNINLKLNTLTIPHNHHDSVIHS